MKETMLFDGWFCIGTEEHMPLTVLYTFKYNIAKKYSK